MSVNPVTTEELRVMFEDEKLSDMEIGQRVGLGTSSAAKLRRRRGFIREVRPNARNRIPPETLQRCSDLLDEGYSFNAIMSMVKIDSKAISRHFPGRGFTREQTVEAQTMGRKLRKVGL